MRWRCRWMGLLRISRRRRLSQEVQWNFSSLTSMWIHHWSNLKAHSLMIWSRIQLSSMCSSFLIAAIMVTSMRSSNPCPKKWVLFPWEMRRSRWVMKRRRRLQNWSTSMASSRTNRMVGRKICRSWPGVSFRTRAHRNFSDRRHFSVKTWKTLAASKDSQISRLLCKVKRIHCLSEASMKKKWSCPWAKSGISPRFPTRS